VREGEREEGEARSVRRGRGGWAKRWNARRHPTSCVRHLASPSAEIRGGTRCSPSPTRRRVQRRGRLGEAKERAQAPAPDVLRLPPPPHPSAAYGARPSSTYVPHLELAVRESTPKTVFAAHLLWDGRGTARDAGVDR
jgi:hypothetical protein